MQDSAPVIRATERDREPLGRFVAVDGAQLHYLDSGAGSAVVFVHGWTLDLEMWAPQAAALEDAFRVIRLDRRGFGRSSGQPSLERDADDIAKLLDHLGIERAALVGMSQGARAVLAAARTLGARVTALVLDGPPDIARPAASLVADGPFAHFSALARGAGLDAFRREWLAHPLMQLRSTDAGPRALLAAMIARYPGRDLLAPARAAPPPPSGAPELPRVPTLVICGTRDLPERIAAARALAQRLVHGELALVEEAGHLPNLDAPAAYNRLVRDFLHRHVETRS